MKSTYGKELNVINLDENIFKSPRPIIKTISEIKRIFNNMDYRGSKVVLLIDHSMKPHIDIFKLMIQKKGMNEIDVRFMSDGNFSKDVIMEYVNSGKYKRIKLIDNNLTNIKNFISLNHESTSFCGVFMNENGNMERIKCV